MKCFIIHDELGRLYAIEYAEKQNPPTRLQYLQEEIPDGSMITGIDMSDNEVPKLLFTPPKDSALEKKT